MDGIEEEGVANCIRSGAAKISTTFEEVVSDAIVLACFEAAAETPRRDRSTAGSAEDKEEHGMLGGMML